MKEETGEDTIQAAHKTRQHQGYHEAEVTFGGEADLHKHYRRCKKNPGHTQFIPIGDFKIEHLPPDYRDNLVLDYIRAEADVTCRLSVRYTSESRPKFDPLHPHSFYPFYQDRGYDWMRVGTGWVHRVHVYKEKDGLPPVTQTPKKEWAKVYIKTASHVVFDSDEARHTTCHLCYDEGSTHISQCPSLTGLSVVKADIKQDGCWMKCVTHDMDLADKLDKMCEHRDNLWNKVYEKYMSNKNVSCDSDPTSGLTVIISHPHGLSKQVTVGEWTHRQILSPPTHKSGTGYEFVDTSYSYNTATCPGSSGAHVITLAEDRPWRWYSYYSHVHSEGGDGNNNKSGVRWEFLPSSSVFRARTSYTQTLSTSSPTYVQSDTSNGGVTDVQSDTTNGGVTDVQSDTTNGGVTDVQSDTTNGGVTDVQSDTTNGGVTDVQSDTTNGGVTDVQSDTTNGGVTDVQSDTTNGGVTDVQSDTTNGGVTDVQSDTTNGGVTDDENKRNLSGKGRKDVKNVRQNKQRAAARERKLSESEDETAPKERNQEPKGDVSKGEDSTETSTGGRTSNEADDSKSIGAATATGKATTSLGACKKKGKAPKRKKQKKKNFLMSDSDLDDDDDVDHHNNDDDDGDLHCDHIDKDDEDEEDDESYDLSDDVHHYVNECNDVQHYVNECNDVQQYVNECNDVQHYVSECNDVQQYVNECNDVQHYVNECNDVQHYVNESNDIKCFNPTGNQAD